VSNLRFDKHSPAPYPLQNPCYTHLTPLVYPSYWQYEGYTRGLGRGYDGYRMGYRINRLTRSLEKWHLKRLFGTLKLPPITRRQNRNSAIDALTCIANRLDYGSPRSIV